MQVSPAHIRSTPTSGLDAALALASDPQGMAERLKQLKDAETEARQAQENAAHEIQALDAARLEHTAREAALNDERAKLSAGLADLDALRSRHEVEFAAERITRNAEYESGVNTLNAREDALKAREKACEAIEQHAGELSDFKRALDKRESDLDTRESQLNARAEELQTHEAKHADKATRIAAILKE